MFFLFPSRISSINLCLKWTDLCFITDSVRTWGPYLYTTVSDKHQTVFFFVCLFLRAMTSLLSPLGSAVLAGRYWPGRRQQRSVGGTEGGGAAAVREGHGALVRGWDGGGAGQYWLGEGGVQRRGRYHTMARGCFTNSYFHGRTPMESISTTSSLSSQKKNSKKKSSVLLRRISLVRDGTKSSQWAVPRTMSLHQVFHVFFFFQPLRRAADTSPHQTSPPAVAESADERSNQGEAGNHPRECHLGRSDCFPTPWKHTRCLSTSRFGLIFFFFFLLCVQARRRRCSATWRETSWDRWWTWSTSCWVPESTSPSTTGSWISSWTPWVCAAVRTSKHRRSRRLGLVLLLLLLLTDLNVCRSGAVGEEAEVGGASWL